MACKRLLQEIAPASNAALRDYTTTLIASLRTSQEGQEGLGAFFEKRPPAWQETR